MDDTTKQFINHLIQTNFADLKGSSAELHLEIGEQILNELVEMAKKSQEKAHPWLAFVTMAEVKGSVRLDVKLNV